MTWSVDVWRSTGALCESARPSSQKQQQNADGAIASVYVVCVNVCVVCARVLMCVCVVVMGVVGSRPGTRDRKGLKPELYG